MTRWWQAELSSSFKADNRKLELPDMKLLALNGVSKWSYKKKKHKKVAYRKSLKKEPTVKRCLLTY